MDELSRLLTAFHEANERNSNGFKCVSWCRQFGGFRHGVRLALGTYIWTSDKEKKFWRVKPTICEVEPRGQDKITCKSEGEFNQLIQKYFGLVL